MKESSLSPFFESSLVVSSFTALKDFSASSSESSESTTFFNRFTFGLGSPENTKKIAQNIITTII